MLHGTHLFAKSGKPNMTQNGSDFLPGDLESGCKSLVHPQCIWDCRSRLLVFVPLGIKLVYRDKRKKDASFRSTEMRDHRATNA